MDKKEDEEIECVIPDKDKLLSDVKAYVSHHETTSQGQKRKLVELENDYQELDMENKSLVQQVKDLSFQLAVQKLVVKNREEKEKTIQDKNKRLKSMLKDKDESISALEQQNERLSKKIKCVEILLKPLTTVEINEEENQMTLSLGPKSAKAARSSSTLSSDSDSHSSSSSGSSSKGGKCQTNA